MSDEFDFYLKWPAIPRKAAGLDKRDAARRTKHECSGRVVAHWRTFAAALFDEAFCSFKSRELFSAAIVDKGAKWLSFEGRCVNA